MVQHSFFLKSEFRCMGLQMQPSSVLETGSLVNSHRERLWKLAQTDQSRTFPVGVSVEGVPRVVHLLQPPRSAVSLQLSSAPIAPLPVASSAASRGSLGHPRNVCLSYRPTSLPCLGTPLFIQDTGCLASRMPAGSVPTYRPGCSQGR